MDNVPLWQIYLSGYLELVGAVILFYDHLITLGDEYRLVWRGARGVPQFRFLLNRYFAIVTTITTVIGHLSKFSSVESCTTFLLYRQIVMEMVITMSSYNMFLRVYGLYGRDKRVLVLFTSFLLGAIATGVWALLGQHSDVSIQLGCQTTVSQSSAIGMAAGWEGALLFDTMVFFFTMVKSHRRPRWWASHSNDLLTTAFRDGSIYYAVLGCANMGNTLTFYLLPPVLKGALCTTVSCVAATAVCRVMLNIHKTAAYDERLSTSSTVDEWNTSCGAFTTRLTIRADCPSIMTMDSYRTGEDGPFITMAGATEVRSSQTLSKESTLVG